MSKFYKTVLIIAGSLLLVGVLLLGSVYVLYSVGDEPRIKDLVSLDMVFSYPDKDFSELYINASYGEFEFVPGDSWAIAMDNVYQKGVDVSANEGRLSLSLRSAEDIRILGWNLGYNMNFNRNKGAKITIVYPKDTQMSILNSVVGIGSLDITGLSMNKCVAQVGIGSIYMDNCKVNTSGVIQVAAGKMDAIDTSLNLTKVSIGAGKCDIKLPAGTSSTSVSASVDLGSKNIR